VSSDSKFYFACDELTNPDAEYLSRRQSTILEHDPEDIPPVELGRGWQM